MKLPRLMVAFFLVGIVAGQADDAPATTDSVYTLKKRSSFTLPEDTRVPFWVIGWKKPVKGAASDPDSNVAVVPKTPPIKPESFKVTSILIGNPPIAVINGRSFELGEVILANVKGIKVRLLVKDIKDGGVILEQMDDQKYQIQVPIYRPDVVVPKVDVPKVKEEFEMEIN